MMNMQEQGQYVGKLTAIQTALYLHICALLGNDAHAEDVLQDTNVYIWQNIGHYDPAKGEFIAWATAMATFQVRRFRRDAERERARLVYDTDVRSEERRVGKECRS